MWLQILEKKFSALQEPGDHVTITGSGRRKSGEVLPSRTVIARWWVLPIRVSGKREVCEYISFFPVDRADVTEKRSWELLIGFYRWCQHFFTHCFQVDDCHLCMHLAACHSPAPEGTGVCSAHDMGTPFHSQSILEVIVSPFELLPHPPSPTPPPHQSQASSSSHSL